MCKLREFDQASSAYAANQLLAGWLSDDTQRAELYEEMAASNPRRTTLRFKSLAYYDQAAPGELTDAFLVAAVGDIEHALKHLSVKPYAALGGGRFMLAIDAGEVHAAQRKYALSLLDAFSDEQIKYCARVAFRRAAVLALKKPDFDLAALAESVALRFASLLFGFPDNAYGMLRATMQRLYQELCFQILGRHFSGEPLPPRAPVPPGQLSLDEWVKKLIKGEDGMEPEQAGCESGCGKPILFQMREYDGGYDLELLSIIVHGLITGMIGNVQAGVSIAMSEWFNRRGEDGLPLLVTAQRAAATDNDTKLGGMLMKALTNNPPAAFLPRAADGRGLKWTDAEGVEHTIPDGADVVLAMGAAKRHDLVFGGVASDTSYVHQCVGERVIYPLLLHSVKRLLLLPGVAQQIDPDTGRPRPLVKHRGFACEKYPLQYVLGRRLRQQPLAVIMKVKPPIAESAAALGKIIAAGAPSIEESLRDSKHVHYAFFQLLAGGTQLGLFTVYDGEFDAYIEHFGLKVKLFDSLFKYIVDAPRLPVRKYPKEFVETIRKHNVAPFGGYFFSAHPTATVSKIGEVFPPEADDD
jgi:hypothetical protein